ncbi:MAG: patatin family protein [Clostridia bacterium]|nr:patatin family protein [Clostridia bacterium]
MKLGLVLEGGASRSLFSCGVMDALLDENIIADYVIGVSAGIAYGTSYVSRQKGRNLELSLNYMHDKRYMGTRHLLNPKNRSYYNMDFAFRQIPEKIVPFDFDAFAKNTQDSVAIAVVTNLETGQAEYKELPSDDWDYHIRLLWASCALPILFQPENLNGTLFMDGGISDPIPFRRAIEDGCDKIITVLTRERSYTKASDSSERIASKIYKKYPNFAKTLLSRHENYNRDRNELFELEKNNNIFVIAPTDTTGFSRTERRPEKLKEMYDDGYQTAKKNMSELKKYLGIS